MTTHAHPHLSWTLEPAILVTLVAYAWLWIRRYRTVRRTAGTRGAGARRLAAFIGSVIALIAALVSPLDSLGEKYLFSAHMVQHLLLGDIAPLLMLLALSRTMMRPLTRRLQTLERALGPLAHPGIALVVWLGLVYLWHVPALYDAALDHSAVHALIPSSRRLSRKNSSGAWSRSSAVEKEKRSVLRPRISSKSDAAGSVPPIRTSRGSLSG